jgi:hypothetical protein
MIERIRSNYKLSLRAKATLAWNSERAVREAARLEKRARQIASVMAKLKEILGPEYEIKVGIDKKGVITATVDDLRFTAISYKYELISLSLVEKCSRCGEELPIGLVSDLADVGELLERSETEDFHECSQQ